MDHDCDNLYLSVCYPCKICETFGKFMFQVEKNITFIGIIYVGRAVVLCYAICAEQRVDYSWRFREIVYVCC